jgi:hypothetical protein
MAASGSREPDLGAVKLGASRTLVENELGKAKTTATLSDGGRIDTYEYTLGNEPSAGRAIGHGAADLLTFGIWEVIGTPIESANQGEVKRVRVTYGSDDKVKALE